MAGARGCFNCGGCAWCFRVVALVVSPSRALCADACTYHLPSSFFFVVRGEVLTGTASFFYTFLYIDRAESNYCPIHSVCVVSRVLSNSWTPGCKLPKGRNAYLVNVVSFRSDPRSRVNDSRLSSCVHLVSYNCESYNFFFAHFLGGHVGFEIVDDGHVCDDGAGGLEGHVSRDCTMEQKAKSCYRCGREGHIVRFVFPVSCAICVIVSCDTIHALPVQFVIAVA